MMQQILNRIASVTPLDTAAMESARNRQQELTKPAGSLGMLEDIAIQMAGITKQSLPKVEQKAVIIMAGDHGVAREGVSAYPKEVTSQMVLNFLANGAAINVLANLHQAELTVVDVGVDADFGQLPGLLHKKVRRGSRNMLHEAAMTEDDLNSALQTPWHACIAA